MTIRAVMSGERVFRGTGRSCRGWSDLPAGHDSREGDDNHGAALLWSLGTSASGAGAPDVENLDDGDGAVNRKLGAK
jgi:hypothetical protein